MKAKDFLKQITKLDKLIENKIAEKEQWRAIATNTTAGGEGGERVKSSGNQQKMEAAIIKYIDLEKEIDQSIDQLIDTKRDVISVIEQLNHIEYDILHKHYVQHLTFDEIGAIYKKTYSWITTVHGRALKNVQNIIDKRDECRKGILFTHKQ